MFTGWWFVFLLFFHILGTIIPFDFHIFQRGGSTTNQFINMFKIKMLAQTWDDCFAFSRWQWILWVVLLGLTFFACLSTPLAVGVSEK
jgi:hypothetical protein